MRTQGTSGDIGELLGGRRLPDLLVFSEGSPVENDGDWKRRREEILEILRGHVYGRSPTPPSTLHATVVKREERAFAGKAVDTLVEVGFNTPHDEFSFPLRLVVPRGVERPALFLHIAFRPDVPDLYYPAEEIVDSGFAVATLCYEDVAPDRDDGFREGLPAHYDSHLRKPDEWGKIAMWAWAAQRAMDYLQGRDDIDREHIAVVGHSRLGKTALWCAACDERFFLAVSNESGCAGASLSRGKRGERITDITGRFGYWFCENYRNWSGREDEAPFDQHFLLAAIAPRRLYVASAEEDSWSDPESELLACAAATPVYELLGLEGLRSGGALPETGERLHDGAIAYHRRAGTHHLSRSDWRAFIDYARRL